MICQHLMTSSTTTCQLCIVLNPKADLCHVDPEILAMFQDYHLEVLAATIRSTFHKSQIYTVFQKKLRPLMFDNNFGKCVPVFKILSPGDL